MWPDFMWPELYLIYITFRITYGPYDMQYDMEFNLKPYSLTVWQSDPIPEM